MCPGGMMSAGVWGILYNRLLLSTRKENRHLTRTPQAEVAGSTMSMSFGCVCASVERRMPNSIFFDTCSTSTMHLFAHLHGNEKRVQPLCLCSQASHLAEVGDDDGQRRVDPVKCVAGLVDHTILDLPCKVPVCE